jgi:hypothetical protein
MKSIITRLSLLFLTALIFGTSLITAIRPERVLAATGADEFAFVYDPTNVGAKDKSGLINALRQRRSNEEHGHLHISGWRSF